MHYLFFLRLSPISVFLILKTVERDKTRLNTLLHSILSMILIRNRIRDNNYYIRRAVLNFTILFHFSIGEAMEPPFILGYEE